MTISLKRSALVRSILILLLFLLCSNRGSADLVKDELLSELKSSRRALDAAFDNFVMEAEEIRSGKVKSKYRVWKRGSSIRVDFMEPTDAGQSYVTYLTRVATNRKQFAVEPGKPRDGTLPAFDLIERDFKQYAPYANALRLDMPAVLAPWTLLELDVLTFLTKPGISILRVSNESSDQGPVQVVYAKYTRLETEDGDTHEVTHFARLKFLTEHSYAISDTWYSSRPYDPNRGLVTQVRYDFSHEDPAIKLISQFGQRANGERANLIEYRVTSFEPTKPPHSAFSEKNFGFEFRRPQRRIPMWGWFLISGLAALISAFVIHRRK
jgi:hypothetical protein